MSTVARQETANDRFKRGYNSWFASCLILAVLAHYGAFAFWPELTAKDISLTAVELTSIELPPEIEIPPPPQSIARPATPIVATTSIDEDITIALTTFEDNPVSALPPPPEERAVVIDPAQGPTFTPYTVQPGILNRDEVIRAMEREYPPLLRDAGIGGTVKVYFFIDENGRVIDYRIDLSSGHTALDDAALKVAGIYRFSPALNRDKKVPVWVSFPITFQVR